MLPFLKDRHEAASSEPVQNIRRASDEKEDYGMLDAIVDDMMDAFHNKDKKLLRSCLEALMEHIEEEDEIQDMEQFEE